MLRLIGAWRGQFEDETIPDPPLLYGKQFCTELDSSQIVTILAAARLMNPPYLLFYRSSDSTTGCAIDAKCNELLFAINEGAKKVAAASVLRSAFLFFIKANSLAFCGFLLVSQLQVLLVPEISMFLVLQQVPFCSQARLLKISFS
jgi:hypothetical protein